MTKSIKPENVIAIIAIALGCGVLITTLSSLNITRDWEAEFAKTPEARELKIHHSNQQNVDYRADVVEMKSPETEQPLTRKDLSHIKKAIPENMYVYSKNIGYVSTLQNPNGYLPTFSVSHDYFAAYGIRLLYGKMFTDSDYAAPSSHALLTLTGMKRLGLTAKSLGQSYTFKDEPPVIILGVVSDAASSVLNDDATVMLRPQNMSMGSNELLVMGWHSPQTLQAVLNERYSVSQNMDIQLLLQDMRKSGVVIAIFASLGIVIALSNVMNIMMARLLGRRKEIRIRRCLGATRADIFKLFFVEALQLVLWGIVWGVALGFALTQIYNYFIAILGGNAIGMANISITASGVAVGMLASLGAGMLFSIAPAWLASVQRLVGE